MRNAPDREDPTVETTTAADGTTLAYDRVGQGPALVFVPGVFNLQDKCAPIAAQLAEDFTCFTYDRRARGDSSNTEPYAIEREVEDLQAMIDVAGGRAAVFGFSSGAILALRAAADGLPIDRLFLYEPPFRFDDQPPAAAADLPERLQRMVDEGRAADVVSIFQLEGIGLPPDMVAGSGSRRSSPNWRRWRGRWCHDATLTTAMPVPTRRWPPCGCRPW